MKYNSIDSLIVDNRRNLLIERLQARYQDALYNPTELELEDELNIYKDEEKRKVKQAILEKVSSLIGNNCATIEAFPEAGGNYQLWIDNNIVNNDDLDEAESNVDTIIEMEATLEIQKEKIRVAEELKVLGEKSATVCKNVINLISGWMITRNFTTAQIDSIKNQFAAANAYLFGNQPWAAKEAISVIQIDGVTVTQEIYDIIMNEFANSGLEGL